MLITISLQLHGKKGINKVGGVITKNYHAPKTAKDNNRKRRKYTLYFTFPCSHIMQYFTTLVSRLTMLKEGMCVVNGYKFSDSKSEMRSFANENSSAVLFSSLLVWVSM